MYKPSTKGAWKGRVDALDGDRGLRWHQVISFLDLSQEINAVPEQEIAFAVVGFCCDEGVTRNMGRIGAASGPAALRSAMASFAHHLPDHVRLYDAGDVICTNQNLEEAQEQLGKKVARLLQHGYRPLVLGGGHEIAFGHFLGLEKVTEAQKLGILNFDAHFDLRSYEKQPSSGTPFLQIADRLQEQGKEFIYNCIGIQEYGNTRILFDTAERLQVTYTFADELHPHTIENHKERLQAFLNGVDKLYITIDLDVFASSHAPGVSAGNALGLQPALVLDFLNLVVQSGKLLSLDIAELNPAYDIDNRTAKLGAGLLYQVVKQWSAF